MAEPRMSFSWPATNTPDCSVADFYPKKQKATNQKRLEAVVENWPWHRAIFPWGDPQSIFAAATFHLRVRDGIGVGPSR